MTNVIGTQRPGDTPGSAGRDKPPTEIDDDPIGQPLLAAAAIWIGLLGLMFGTEHATQLAAAVVGFAGAAWLLRVFSARGKAHR